jgi:hypothetical protein
MMMALAVAGIAAFPLLPVAPLPQVDFPTVQVAARLPRASPETMAATVAQPLERQFAQISGLTDMTSTSTLGSTSIVLQFDLDRNVDAAAQDVQAAITAANRQLPTNLPSPPTYRKVNPADSPILVIAAYSDTLPITRIDDLADTVVAQQISQIKGAAQVAIGGEQKPAVRIQVDPAKLQMRGLTLEDVRSTIALATSNAAKGSIYNEYFSAHRERRGADRGGAEWLERNRLHGRLHQPAARGGLHPLAADGRHRRPAVSRTFRHGHSGHPGIDGGFSYADAGVGLPFPANRIQTTRRAAYPHRTGIRGPRCGLWPYAERCVAPPIRDAAAKVEGVLLYLQPRKTSRSAAVSVEACTNIRCRMRI